MTDEEKVSQALAELWDIVKCRCHEAYTGRGLHDPDCQCDSTDALQIVTDRIEKLENSLAWYQKMDAMSSDHVVDLTDKLDDAKAKLTKAEAYLQKISRHANRSCSAIAAHALAELEGK